MNPRNTSDLIEAYLKKSLERQSMIEIRRTEMADLFNCVPSQINYVINTRFTIQRGYAVESKRGGGGYIRIKKVQVSNRHQFLKQINQLFENELDERDGHAIVQRLFEEELITKREGNLLLAVLSKQVLNTSNEEKKVRASILHSLLERLSYEEKE